jgi:quinol monooxygenase YgiN
VDAVQVVTYVEVAPSSTPAALELLRRYRSATTRRDGNLRCEVLQRIGQPHQLAVLEVWTDEAIFGAHLRQARMTEVREGLAAIRIAPLDERIHRALWVGSAAGAAPPPGAIHVVTHVDVIPPRKDDGAAALESLAHASRASAGNLRFDVVQQTSRPNHFTVIEAWTDANSAEAHSLAPPTRAFRDTLAPLTGALYDERFYLAVD